MVPPQEQKAEGLEEGTGLKSALRPSPRPSAHHPWGRGHLVSDEAPSAKSMPAASLKTLCPMPPATGTNPLARVSAWSYSG